MSDSLWPHGLYSPWNSPGLNTEVGKQPFPSLGNLPSLRIKPRSLTLQADSLPNELSGKLKGVWLYPNMVPFILRDLYGKGEFWEDAKRRHSGFHLY